MTLVCFAVKEEARWFRPEPGAHVRILVTGMGAAPAATSFRQSLQGWSGAAPALVLTCGFAGGLNPELGPGVVLYETADTTIASRLMATGARPARIHCAPRVAVTRAEKAALREGTQADAVEMESGVIQKLCADAGLPCATVRAISDSALVDLPIDFNPLITPRGTLRIGGLIRQVLLNPAKVAGLLALQRNTARAARALGRCLEQVVVRQR